jgi:hypothetical protein
MPTEEIPPGPIDPATTSPDGAYRRPISPPTPTVGRLNDPQLARAMTPPKVALGPVRRLPPVHEPAMGRLLPTAAGENLQPSGLGASQPDSTSLPNKLFRF